MATAVRNAMPYKMWLRVFKQHMREIATGNMPDELDGYLNSGDFSNYHDEGLSPAAAAEAEVSAW